MADDNFVVKDFEITTLAADSFGNLWVGHHGRGGNLAIQGGIERVDFNNPNTAQHFGTDADAKCLNMQNREHGGLATRRTNSIAVDRDGTVWSAHKWDNISYTGEPYVQIVYGIPITIRGGASIFTPGAFSRKEADWQKFASIGTFSNVTGQLHYPAHTCNPGITETAQGRTFTSIATHEHSVWVSIFPYTDEDDNYHPPQVQLYDRKSGTYRSYFNFETLGLSGPGIFNGFYLHPNCNIFWTTMSANQGFMVSGIEEGKKIINSTTHPEILPPGTRINTNAIWGNKYGNVFIGTNNGLLVYKGSGGVEDPKSYNFYTVEHGLTSNNIKSGYSDRDTVQWVATNSGIMRMVFDEAKPMVTANIELTGSTNDRPDEVEFWGKDGEITKEIKWDKVDGQKEKWLFLFQSATVLI